MAVDIILAFISPIVEHAIGPINTHICHAFYCKSNLRHLKEEVDKLRNERERLQRLVDEERRKGKVIEDDVAKWILEVDGITEMVERELAQYEDGVKKKCFMGLCPNFKTRYRFGKKAEQKLATVRAKLKKQRSFGSISYHVVPSGVEGMSGKGYQAMQSRIPAEVYSAIELSYKHLGNEELKAIFLLCSRMGYNASIHDLLKYSMGSGLFSDVATIEEVRDKVNSLLHKLKTSSLLLDGDTSKQFSIHDVVRDVAISIAFRDHNVFLRSDEVELKWQCEDSVESHEIWLHGNSFGLPEDIQYPLLKVLNMNSEDPSLEVPGNIFRGMQKLKVLGLTNLSLSSPEFISSFPKKPPFIVPSSIFTWRDSHYWGAKKIRNP
ncbi:hypothetical protein OIU84_017969 [Salix udensis]|uniref:NB-ARC domain-containing protein n=1 Tax=Salix udensis TaxID=889485 RepID=A0AAD6PLJ8_9ROSI|nr:hypothetical protein OIU84_017969 [Salix udensis]